jgi:hypothetical protein
VNTIWSLKDPDGRSITSFEGMAQLGTRHFQNLLKQMEEFQLMP